MAQQTEIAYLRSGFVRVVQKGRFFEVQANRIRGENKPGALTFWARLYVVTELDRAIKLLESYA
jgi:hypothetical protein